MISDEGTLRTLAELLDAQWHSIDRVAHESETDDRIFLSAVHWNLHARVSLFDPTLLVLTWAGGEPYQLRLRIENGDVAPSDDETLRHARHTI